MKGFDSPGPTIRGERCFSNHAFIFHEFHINSFLEVIIMRIVREVRFLPTPQDGNILISIICRPFYYIKSFPAETVGKFGANSRISFPFYHTFFLYIISVPLR